MWPSSAATTRYGEMGMVGLRDLFVVAPASSFHHHHHQEPLFSDIAASNTALGVGVIPLLTAAPLTAADEDIFNTNRNRSSGIQVWQQNQQPQHPNYLKNPTPNFLQSGGGIGGPTASGVGTTTCQDCGNQAKKDCTHRRCRTCCKSRGFDCATHVKSTWVPASRRRERQLMASAAVATAGSSGSTSGTKKPRLIASQTTTSHTSASNTPPKSFDTSSSHQDASFKEGLPGQVRAPAVFKCVRVTAVDDGEDEYAYQAVVKIGRHVFKGFLYDQGMEGREEFPNISELHLGGGGGRNGASSNPIIDPSDNYAASGGGLLGGSSYGNQIN
ncbi:protein LATERAL ROOT PRIMORDIUM 1-like [Actinidia eriantha]|uniref:protein LATERAL ROOT PRIMORDIUM 1-like n=1 Tax=Actinidia eriantha TaxID=165200 RepID=UPI002587B92C|nr:protein LATERAL ROOT PRIMORDIUM 1-like [Actinidia eriantha]XP_057483512.1 protein LATERAL ROOT PRIMORDIUM 1-like [Actinidia eriantha]